MQLANGNRNFIIKSPHFLLGSSPSLRAGERGALWQSPRPVLFLRRVGGAEVLKGKAGDAPPLDHLARGHSPDEIRRLAALAGKPAPQKKRRSPARSKTARTLALAG